VGSKHGCFIISTIADPGSARRAHADAVLKAIIEPACDIVEREGVNQQPVTIAPRWRGERDKANTYIDERIVNAILDTDLLVVVAFENNPNVFYEAGIAHAAGRPLLMLRYEKFEMPFDLSRRPYISYADTDLVRAIDNTHPATQLAGMMTAQLQNLRGKYTDPFGRPELGPLSTERVLERFSSLKYKDWSKILLDARQIVLAGISLHELVDPMKGHRFFLPEEPDGALPQAPNATIGQLLAYAITTGGADVTIMMMSPDSPALPSLLLQPASSDLTSQEALRIIRPQIAESAKWWLRVQQRVAGLAPHAEKAPGAMRVVQVFEGCVPQRITWTDREMVATPFFNCYGLNSGPAVRTRAGHLWHDLTHKELQLLIALNEQRKLIADEPFAA
jgi:hypothetical protein